MPGYRFLYRSPRILVVANLVFAGVVRDKAKTLKPLVGDYRAASLSPFFDELLLAGIVGVSNPRGRTLRAFVACL